MITINYTGKFWDAASQLEDAKAAVLNAGVPVLLWNGQDDPYHDPMKAFATANKLQFLSTRGDHIKAIKVYGRESAEGIRAFLDSMRLSPIVSDLPSGEMGYQHRKDEPQCCRAE